MSFSALPITTSLVFVDETGDNPLPAGIRVTLTDSTGQIAQGYTTVGGLLVDLALLQGDSVTATFRGSQAPRVQCSFVLGNGPSQTMAVLGYRSPTLSPAGSADVQTGRWPRKFGLAAKTSGGNAYAVAMGLSAMLAAIDTTNQGVLGSERLDSSVSSSIDSWVQDFLGAGTWDRIGSEPDPAYIARVKLWLGAQKPTVYATSLLLNAYLAAQLAYGGVTPGPNGWPTVQVFDIMSDPTRAYAAGCTDFQGEFVVYFDFPNAGSFAPWSLGVSYLGVSTYLGGNSWNAYTSGSDIIALVNVLKAEGTLPLYVSNVS